MKFKSGMYAITDGSMGYELYAKVQLALAGHISMLQYRDKSRRYARSRYHAQKVKELCDHYKVPLIINDDVRLAIEVNAAGVHLGRDDMSYTEARRALGQKAIIGVSCYADLNRAQQASRQGVDYVAFGACFPSDTKPEAPPVALSVLAEAKKSLNVPVCAIGGITLDNLPQVIDNGADLVAVSNGIFYQRNVQLTALQMSRYYKRKRGTL